jgi:hypothetical protein
VQVVGNISSKGMLLDAVAASSYLPFWSGPSAVTTIDGLPAVYDGGFSYPLPCPPGEMQQCFFPAVSDTESAAMHGVQCLAVEQVVEAQQHRLIQAKGLHRQPALHWILQAGILSLTVSLRLP